MSRCQPQQAMLLWREDTGGCPSPQEERWQPGEQAGGRPGENGEHDRKQEQADEERTRGPEAIRRSAANPASYHGTQTYGDEESTDIADMHILLKQGSDIGIHDIEPQTRQQRWAERQQELRFSNRSQTCFQRESRLCRSGGQSAYQERHTGHTRKSRYQGE